MLATVNRYLYSKRPRARQVLTRITYEYVSVLDKDRNATFMNYGFTSLEPEAERLKLDAEEEKNRYEIQLYHHLATMIPVKWDGMDVLEVSSGRGGGACYITQHFKPNSVTGVDFSRKAVAFCNRYYEDGNLSFVHGNAEELHFPDHSFDIIINLEASFYYPNFEKFLGHVVRLLRPRGYFLYADMRYAEDLATWHRQLHRMGLELLSEEDITRNVVRALSLDRKRRRKILQSYAPKVLQKPFADFYGITGADLRNGSHTRDGRSYKCFVFRK